MVQTTVLGLVTLALSSYGSPDMEGQSLENLQENTEQWVKEIQLSGTFRLRGKGFAALVTPEGNFWVEYLAYYMLRVRLNHLPARRFCPSRTDRSPK
ncbi:hypothetical protein OAQ34_06815 [Opitutales bacterium]|nr:hypothetical protein [Opitutales bacterium]